MSDDTQNDRQPSWQPEQMETDDGGPESDQPPRPEIDGGLRGGGGPTWNKGSMRRDDESPVPEDSMKESEQGPWGSAEAAERREREVSRTDS
jgi:hypothetical protein